MSQNSRAAVDAIEFAYELKALVPALNAALAEVFHPIGLSCVQADALMALEERQPVTLSGLSQHLVAESGHPSRLVSRLEAMGLVRRESSPHDGRASLLTLTAEGAEKAAAARAARAPLAQELAARHGGALRRMTAELRQLRAELDGVRALSS
ncbi:MarR family winged helix-turn-helix transcriptional regulator [Agromyces bauzanensis]